MCKVLLETKKGAPATRRKILFRTVCISFRFRFFSGFSSLESRHRNNRFIVKSNIYVINMTRQCEVTAIRANNITVYCIARMSNDE